MNLSGRPQPRRGFAAIARDFIPRAKSTAARVHCPTANLKSFASIACALLLHTIPTPAAELWPPLSPAINRLPVAVEGKTRGTLTWDFVPQGADATTEIRSPTTVLEGRAGPHDKYLSCRWKVAQPDRNDGFSVRWTGQMRIQPATVEIRLRAEDRATFFLNGTELLTARPGVPSSTDRVFLDGRRHDLRVDYIERSGPASVFLEWRRGKEPWEPLRPAGDPRNPKGSTPGWNGTYYTDEAFAEQAFERTVAAIGFDWGSSGPFDRLEDLPSATLSWGNDLRSGFFGSFSPNRPGVLRLGWHSAKSMPDATSEFSIQGAILEYRSGPSAAFEIGFDRPPTSVEAPVSTPPLTGVESPESQTVQLLFPLGAGESLRFWERNSSGMNGGSVQAALEQARTNDHQTRVHLLGEFSVWDEAVCQTGSWWIRVLLERLKQAGTQANGPRPSPDPLRPAPHLADLPKEVSEAASLFVPSACDSISDFPEEAGERPLALGLVAGSGEELTRLERALAGWKQAREGSVTVGSASTVVGPPRVPFEETSLASGLARFFTGASQILPFHRRDPAGGYQLGGVDWADLPTGVSHWTCGESGLFLWTADRKSFFISDLENGMEIAFSSAARVERFTVIDRTAWEAQVRLKQETALEIFPAERVGQATWDGRPLTLVRQGNRYRIGRVPSSGILRVEFLGQGQKSTPR